MSEDSLDDNKKCATPGVSLCLKTQKSHHSLQRKVTHEAMCFVSRVLDISPMLGTLEDRNLSQRSRSTGLATQVAICRCRAGHIAGN